MEGANAVIIPPNLAKLVGKWVGTNQLWLMPGEPVRESASTMVVALAAQERFVTLTYTWADEGKPQDGLLLIGYENDQKPVKAVWVDSFHVPDQIMTFLGTITPEGIASVKASYPAPSGPDWAWRITIEPDGGNSFRLIMHNITPDNQEFLAVETIYKRQP